jgi:hypothetical protein
LPEWKALRKGRFIYSSIVVILGIEIVYLFPTYRQKLIIFSKTYFQKGGPMKQLVSISIISVFAFCSLSFSQDSAALASAASSAPVSSGPALFMVDTIAMAASIEAREPVGVNSEFPVDMGKVSCWVRISSPQAPVSIKFRWYKDGEMVMEWPYSLKTESGRLWSTKSVTPGNWKVDIVDDANNIVKSAICDVK